MATTIAEEEVVMGAGDCVPAHHRAIHDGSDFTFGRGALLFRGNEDLFKDKSFNF